MMDMPILEKELLDLVQTGGVGALITIITVRYLLDLIMAKKGRVEKIKGEEARENYRQKLDQMQTSIDVVRGKIDTLVQVLSKKGKT